MDFYPWQIDFIRKAMSNRDDNMLLCVSTSAGKTLVAELLCLHTLLFSQKDVVLIFPYVSIVQEKVESLVEISNELDFCLEEYAAGRGRIPPKKRTKRPSLFVCTLEKADLLLDYLLKEGSRLGLVVSDEVHMICESGGRGARLECLLSKLCLFQRNNMSMRILAMSATIANSQQVCAFLNDASFVEYNFRPTNLEEYVKIDRNVYQIHDKDISLTRTLGDGYSAEMLKRDPDLLMCLVSECIPKDSCVIFAPTKRQCESLAGMLVELMPNDLHSYRTEERKLLLTALDVELYGRTCPILAKTIPFGVAYHHGGLTMEERKLIEQAFQTKILCVLVATTTLAVGVNLPVRRVIIRSPFSGRRRLTYAQYKQMAGRAGRTGFCTGNGQCFLLIKSRLDFDSIFGEINSDALVCASQLNEKNSQDNPLKSFILSLLSLNLVDNVEEFICDHSLYGLQRIKEEVHADVQECVKELEISKLLQRKDNILNNSLLGSAVCLARLPVEIAHLLMKDIIMFVPNVGLHSTLHLLCLVTPYNVDMAFSPSASLIYSRYCDLNSSDRTVCDRVCRIDSLEKMLIKAIAGRQIKDKELGNRLDRLFLSLAIYSLWNGHGFWKVSDLFQLPRGFLQSLSQLSSSFAHSVLRFCECYPDKFWPVCVLMPPFIQRLTHCVKPELVDLMELPGVRRARANQLFNAGYTNLNLIAEANPSDLCIKIDLLSRRQAKHIVEGSKLILRTRLYELELESNEIASCLSKQNRPE